MAGPWAVRGAKTSGVKNGVLRYLIVASDATAECPYMDSSG